LGVEREEGRKEGKERGCVAARPAVADRRAAPHP
jgi:hypothetical protein